MQLIRHKHYRREILFNLWVTMASLALGSIASDGGVLMNIFLIAAIGFWLGAILPLKRKGRKPSDQIYLKYGLIGTTILTCFMAPLIWNYRLNP